MWNLKKIKLQIHNIVKMYRSFEIDSEDIRILIIDQVFDQINWEYIRKISEEDEREVKQIIRQEFGW